MTGAFSTVLEENEILLGIRIPRLAPNARWGHYKFCRKPGEFAEAMAAVLIDDARGIRKAVIGAVHGPPRVIDDATFIADGFDSGRAVEAVDVAGIGEDEYERQIHFVALKRAAARALSARGVAT
jgi:carbon-monoxide dehydrogenase medium subunit